MPDCKDIDALIVDRLYGELDEAKQTWFDDHVADCGGCHAEWQAFSRTRDVLQQMPEAEPPQSISAILLHEAAKRAPAPSKPKAVRLSDDQKRPGLLDRIGGWLFPVLRHPAAAAVAVLVLVAGVAGTLYIRGDQKVAEPTVASEAPAVPVAAADKTEAIGKLGDRTTERDGLAKDSYGADLLDQEQTKALRLKLEEAQNEEKPKSIEVGTVQRGLKASTKERKQQRSKGKRYGGKAKPQLGGATANAVTGADELIDSDDDINSERERAKTSTPRRSRARNAAPRGGSGGGAGYKGPKSDPAPRRDSNKNLKKDNKSAKDYRRYAKPPATKAAPRKPSPGASAPAQARGRANYTVRKDPKAEQRWANAQQVNLWRAVKGKKCITAARIANDIRDRNPGYYSRNIGNSRNLKPCVRYVRADYTKRLKSRARAARAKAAKKSGASAPKRKKAAPRNFDNVQ